MDPKIINIDDLTNYELYQLEKWGNILPPCGYFPEEMECGAEQMERESEWVERQWEESLHEKEY